MASNEPPRSKKSKPVSKIRSIVTCPICLQTPTDLDKGHFCSNGLQVFDGKTFILRITVRNESESRVLPHYMYYAQIFLLGSASEAEKYLCKYKLSGTGNQEIIVCGEEVVPIDLLNTEDVLQHPGTVMINERKVRFMKHGDDESRIQFNLSIMKKN